MKEQVIRLPSPEQNDAGTPASTKRATFRQFGIINDVVTHRDRSVLV